MASHLASRERAGKARALVKINTSQIELFGRFLERLRTTPDGDGSLLDHSVILWGSGMSDSNSHSALDVPLLLAGKGGGLIKGNRHSRPRRGRSSPTPCSTGAEFGAEIDARGQHGTVGAVTAEDPGLGPGLSSGLKAQDQDRKSVFRSLVSPCLRGGVAVSWRSPSRSSRRSIDAVIAAVKHGDRPRPRAARAARRRQRRRRPTAPRRCTGRCVPTTARWWLLPQAPARGPERGEPLRRHAAPAGRHQRQRGFIGTLLEAGASPQHRQRRRRDSC